VRTGVEVFKVERNVGRPGFTIETSEGVIEANRVVAATGPFQRPVIRPIAPQDTPLLQIHSADYRNPGQLPEGAVLSLITLVQTFAYRWIPTAQSRAVISIIVLAGCCFAAVGASADFIGHFVDMALVLLVVLVPWTAINLIDFYAIHQGKYDINSIFQMDGGIYGRYNPQALLAYAIGIVVQIPFMNTPLYVGPISEHINGADLSWLVGLLITSPLYYWLANRDTGYKRRLSTGKLANSI
jgi:nucleobase:cation symporter-1, NCS1 family